jgi:DNA polymerase-1
MSAVKKEAMRSLAIRGGPWTESEWKDLLEYCGEDTGLVLLLDRMGPDLDLLRALLRGRYMKAVAQMEHTGIPINADAVRQIKTRWPSIRKQFIQDIDADFGVYVGTRFSQKRFRGWLQREGIDWPIRDPKTGSLRLDKKTFRTMAQQNPQVEPLRNLRQMLSQFRDFSLPVGLDGYSRTMLSPFRAKTGRNQPSTTKFLFGLSKWSRQLIQPKPGTVVVTSIGSSKNLASQRLCLGTRE